MYLDPLAEARASPDPAETDPSSEPTEDTTIPSAAPESPGKTETGPVLPQLEDRGRFEILRPLAEGGLSTVFVARDHDLQRDVAVKVLRTASDVSLGRQRFLHEARISARLEHPHIIPIHGLGFRSQDGVPFLMMRLVRGRTLMGEIREYHQRRGRNGRHTAQLGRLLQWLIQACNAMGFAHSQGIIHRDVKPSNIMIGASGEALLVDWGLAKVIAPPGMGATEGEAAVAPDSEEDRSAGSIVGTPAYMAPEQARGQEDQIGARTDIYGMGATLFEVLTGRPPFRSEWGDGVASMLMSVASGPAPRARAMDRAVPVELDSICARAMASMPADRYPTASDLERDMEGWLFGGPIAAFPESRLRRAWRRLRHEVR
jgi:serine/threonine protein kinase